jgi:hypothetical protein
MMTTVTAVVLQGYYLEQFCCNEQSSAVTFRWAKFQSSIVINFAICFYPSLNLLYETFIILYVAYLHNSLLKLGYFWWNF